MLLTIHRFFGTSALASRPTRCFHPAHSPKGPMVVAVVAVLVSACAGSPTGNEEGISAAVTPSARAENGSGLGGVAMDTGSTARLQGSALASPTFTPPSTRPAPRETPRFDFAADERSVNLENLSVEAFDDLAARLKAGNPFAAPSPSRQRRDEPCDTSQRGPGAYPYRMFYVVSSTGTIGRVSLYPGGGMNPAPTAIGVLRDSSNNLYNDVNAFTAAFGAFFGINGNNATTSSTRNKFGRFDPDYVNNTTGVITYTSVGTTLAGSTTIRNFGGMAARLEDQNVTYVQVEWSAVGGTPDNWFEILRSTNANSGFSVISPAPVEWNRFGYYCFTDLAAPACQRMYYQLRTTLAENCTETSQSYYTDTPCP